jgi:hypothetical protein
VTRKGGRVSWASEINCHCSVISSTMKEYIARAGPMFLGSNQESRVSIFVDFHITVFHYE